MKCDVCLTPIPLGKDECPNCGYKIKTTHINTYDASGKGHDHIQVHSKNIQKRVMNKQTSYKNMKTIKQIIVMTLSIIVLIGAFAPVIVSLLGNIDIFNEDISVYEDLSYEEAIEEGYDEDNTISSAYLFEDDLKEMMEDLEYSDITCYEHINKYDEDASLTAYTSVSGYKNDYRYQVIVTHQEGERRSIEYTISGKMDQKIERTQFPLSQDMVNELGNFYFEDAYQVLADKHKDMKQNEDNENIYSIYENDKNIRVYLSEEYYKDRKPPYYYVYYSITK